MAFTSHVFDATEAASRNHNLCTMIQRGRRYATARGGRYVTALCYDVMLQRIVHMCMGVCSRGHLLLLMSCLRSSVRSDVCLRLDSFVLYLSFPGI
jgi:hypothetical protein